MNVGNLAARLQSVDSHSRVVNNFTEVNWQHGHSVVGSMSCRSGQFDCSQWATCSEPVGSTIEPKSRFISGSGSGVLLRAKEQLL